jgi:glycosyltransferase involved in cell wall biosynthesis
MNVWVVVPAYNEGKALGPLLEKLKEKNLSVLVVDDGSTDGTYELSKSYADVTLRNEDNLGKGRSLNRAISYLLGNVDFEYVITMDADGQHSPGDIDSFLHEAETGEAFVIGNRMANPAKMPIIRVFTNIFMSRVISRIVEQHIPDTQCGFRLMRRDVLEQVKIETKKFEIESEILIKVASRGFKVKSVPIESIYFKRGKSKIRPIADTLRFWKFIRRLRREKK